jgi:hypothetical protein
MLRLYPQGDFDLKERKRHNAGENLHSDLLHNLYFLVDIIRKIILSRKRKRGWCER